MAHVPLPPQAGPPRDPVPARPPRPWSPRRCASVSIALAARRRNPLVTRAHLAEAVLLGAVVAGSLGAAAAVGITAPAAGDAAAARAASQRAHATPVSAQVEVHRSEGWWGGLEAPRASVAWTWRGEPVVRELTVAELSAARETSYAEQQAGTPVVWVDRSGQLVERPPTPAAARTDAVLLHLLPGAGALAAGAVLGAGVRAAALRRRSAAWERDWRRWDPGRRVG